MIGALAAYAKGLRSEAFGIGGVRVPRPAWRQTPRIELANEVLEIRMIPRFPGRRLGVAPDGFRHGPILSHCGEYPVLRQHR